MLGTWQPTRSLRSRHRQLADGEQFEDAQALGIRQRPTDGGVALSFELGRDRQAIQHPDDHIIACANTQVRGPSPLRQRDRVAPLARMPDHTDHLVDARGHRGRPGADRRAGPPDADACISVDGRRGGRRRPAAHAWPTIGSTSRRSISRRPARSSRAGMINRIATLPGCGEGPRRHHAVGRERRPGLRLGRSRGSGVAVTVVMPAGAVRSKVDACLGYGARVVLHGAHVGETLAELERIRDAEGLEFVHPFDDPAVIAGHGSIGLELLEDLPDLDVVVVGVGGGGLISGVAAALKERRPAIRVYGVEPERSNAVSLALERGEVVRIQPDSVADGLGAPFAGVWTLAMCRRYLDDIVLLDDPTILGRAALRGRAAQAGRRAGRRRRARGRALRPDPDPRRRAGRGRPVRRQRRGRPARRAARGGRDPARGRRRDRPSRSPPGRSRAPTSFDQPTSAAEAVPSVEPPTAIPPRASRRSPNPPNPHRSRRRTCRARARRRRSRPRAGCSARASTS